MNKAIVLVVLAVVASNSFCSDDKNDLKIKTFLGWTGLSLGLVLPEGEYSLKAIICECPVKKEQLLKKARCARNVAFFAALPIASLITGLVTAGAAREAEARSADGLAKGLSHASKVSFLPLNVMVDKPVDLYCEKFKNSEN